MEPGKIPTKYRNSKGNFDMIKIEDSDMLKSELYEMCSNIYFMENKKHSRITKTYLK